MHDVGIIIADEYKSCSAHIGRQLVDLVEPAVDRVTAGLQVRQVALNEIVGLRFAELGVFEIDYLSPRSPHASGA